MRVETTTVGDLSIECKIDDKMDAWAKLELENLKSAQRAMCDSIRNLSIMVTPKKTGALRGSGEVIQKDELTMAVRYGNADVPYARYQEFGSPSWHYTTAGTGAHYLEATGNVVAKRGIKEYLNK